MVITKQGILQNMLKTIYHKININILINYYFIIAPFRRNDTKKTLKAMISHQDFDTLFYQDVDWKIISSIEKQLISLKYNQTHSV